jgi:hypothetical protein
MPANRERKGRAGKKVIVNHQPCIIAVYFKKKLA